MAERFDIDRLDKTAYHVGELIPEIVSSLGLIVDECRIYISRKKIHYAKKHENEYDNYQDYKKHIEAIPDIINSPDYVCVHTDGNSLRYIKTFESKTMLVAVGLKPDGDHLWVSAVFPIKEDKVQYYIDSAHNIIKIT